MLKGFKSGEEVGHTWMERNGEHDDLSCHLTYQNFLSYGHTFKII